VKIKKALITAAGKNQRALPLQTLVDREGVQKSALQIIIEESLSAGVEEICVVIFPGDSDAYFAAAGPHRSRLSLVEQNTPQGYGHAIHCAQKFIDNDPFLHLVGDHLYVSGSAKRCAQQLVEVAAAEDCAVSAVQATREDKLPYYGTVGGRLVANRKQLYVVENVIEKPTPTEAEQKLIVPGLRAGHYLCFFGMHVLTPTVMEILGQLVQQSGGREKVQLSSALAKLASREKYYALELAGTRYNLDVKYGVLIAQLALALSGSDRDELLTQLVELLATREKSHS
jgi:UTP--glucose-1-phosphate uridylyltransferase